MYEINPQDVTHRLKIDNGWWHSSYRSIFLNLPKRAYFSKLYDLVKHPKFRRALILMGPRRVGKTYLLKQIIEQLIHDGTRARNIMYVSIDTPTYLGFSLEQLLHFFIETNGLGLEEKSYVFFDEIQYRTDWEIHLKTLVDTYPNITFIASGSAAAALKMKSIESGAGRFIDFMLPPLMFSEYLAFKNLINQFQIKSDQDSEISIPWDMNGLNSAFIDYINYGGYPEIVLQENLTPDEMHVFVQQGIIDKVLSRDLPTLYGIQNIQELNRLFAMLAFNTGNEISITKISKLLEIDRDTVKKYLQYLEAAYLIVCVRRVDENARHLTREHNFKVYLTNPSMRAALFAPIKETDTQKMGHLAETAIFAQWFHDPRMKNIRFAQWRSGEVDVVHLSEDTLKPQWAYEVKWTDKYFDYPNRLSALINFCKENDIKHIGATTRTKQGVKKVAGVSVRFFPCSLHCYELGQKMLA